MRLLRLSLIAITSAWVTFAAVLLAIRCSDPNATSCRQIVVQGLADFILLRWVFDFQTLITGLLAVAAAAVSVHYLRKQIEKSDEQIALTERSLEIAARNSDDLRLRKLRAHRSITAIYLSDVSFYAKQVVHFEEIVIKYHTSIRVGSVIAPRRPEAPASNTADILLVIELENDNDVINRAQELLNFIQIISARLSEIKCEQFQNGRLQNRYECEDRMLDAAYLHTIASSLYGYARGTHDSDVRKPLSDLAWESIKLLVSEPGHYRFLHQRATDLYGPPPI